MENFQNKTFHSINIQKFKILSLTLHFMANFYYFSATCQRLLTGFDFFYIFAFCDAQNLLNILKIINRYLPFPK